MDAELCAPSSRPPSLRRPPSGTRGCCRPCVPPWPGPVRPTSPHTARTSSRQPFSGSSSARDGVSRTMSGRLRAAWAARPPTSPGADCPPADAIWEAVAGDRSEDEVRTMLAHSVGCPDCSALWRLARELRSAGEADTAATLPAEPVPLRRPSAGCWLVVAGTLAAAAVVVFAILLGDGTRGPSPVVRGTEESRLRADPASATLARAHPVLRWSAHRRAAATPWWSPSVTSPCSTGRAVW